MPKRKLTPKKPPKPRVRATPGPWLYIAPMKGSRSVTGGWIQARVRDHWGFDAIHTVAEVAATQSGVRPLSRVRADGRLLAAAPELLGIVRKRLEILARMPGEVGSNPDHPFHGEWQELTGMVAWIEEGKVRT